MKMYCMLGIICLCATLACNGLSRKQDPANRYRQKVLISAGQSEFEEAVVAVLREKLESKSVSVQVVDRGQLSTQNPKAYTAILLLGAIESDSLREPEAEWMKLVQSPEKKPWSQTIVSTVTGRNWMIGDGSVDAVTGATRISQSKIVATRIYGRIRKILDGNYR